MTSAPTLPPGFCWAYVGNRWRVVRVRPCSVPGCRFDAFQEKPHCIRHWPKPASSASRLYQLALGNGI